MIAAFLSLTTKGGKESSLRYVHPTEKVPGLVGRKVKDINAHLLGPFIYHIF